MSGINNTALEFIAGICGGGFGILCSHPIDSIRVWRQTGRVIKPSFTTLYRGITPPLVGVAMEKSIVFGVYDAVYKRTNNHFIAGVFSGLACTTVVTPTEKIKLNLQCNNNTIKWNLRYLYKGYTPTLFREVPGFGLYFSFYKYFNDRIHVDKKYTPVKTGLLGGLSGSFAWIFIYPSDVVKNRLQSDHLKYSNMRECIRGTLNDHGWKFFFKGHKLAIARAFYLHSGVWLGYEYSKQFIGQFV